MKPFVMGKITPQPGGSHTRPSFSAGAFHDLDCKRGDFCNFRSEAAKPCAAERCD
jgi:hypothetical protein